MLLLLLALSALFWVVYKKWTASYKLWEQRLFPFVPGRFPFGSDSSLALLTTFQGEAIDKIYKQAVSPFIGIYIFRKPFVVIRDVVFVRLVLEKYSSNLEDRTDFQLSDDDPLSHHLFNMEGPKWRGLRAKLTPAFTSDRLQTMFPLFVECSKSLEELLISQVGNTVDVRDLAERFTTDTIWSCAFGQEIKSMKSSGVELRKIGVNAGTGTLARIILTRSFPSLLPFFRQRFVPKNVEKSLLKLIKDTVDHRRKTGVKRHDFLDLLIELKDRGRLEGEETGEETLQQNESFEMTDELMAAQCFMFFAAGFESSSSVQSHCLYELALNPEIQERLCNEIDATLAKHGGITYQSVLEMEYLDMVINETIRKYPTVPILSRHCTKEFAMPAGNKIQQGDRILIPIWSLHRDPNLFPSPEKFDPERFSLKRKETIKPYTYLPFGGGSRACIGKWFGLLQTKVGLITVLRKYNVSPSQKTAIPLQFTGTTVFTSAKGPIKLEITNRKA